MKFINFIFFLIFSIACYTSHANENKYIFVGQNGNEESSQPAFILQLNADALETFAFINENGEVYLKVDKITAISKEDSYYQNLLSSLNTQTLTSPASNSAPILGRDTEEYVRCSNPDCRKSYYARPGHRACPNCGTYN